MARINPLNLEISGSSELTSSKRLADKQVRILKIEDFTRSSTGALDVLAHSESVIRINTQTTFVYQLF